MRIAGRHEAREFVFFVSSLLLALAASCSLDKQTQQGGGQQQAGEVSAGRQGKEEAFVANEFCSACHHGFAEEELARVHELAGVGCERCHGESQRHRSDEDNVTPPQIMYPKDKINPTCMMCHPRHTIRRVPAHETLLAGAETIFDPASQDAGSPLYCTSCHAKDHCIKVRTIRWNKATGELLKD